jgi:hypothetical protein
MSFFSKILLCFFFFIPGFAYTQANLGSFSLYVLIEEPNKKIEEKLSPDELKNYHAEIEIYNSNLKKVVEKYWQIGAKPLFVDKANFDKILGEKASNTLVLINSKYSLNYADYSSYKLSNKLYINRDVVVENFNKKQLPYRSTILEIKRADKPIESSSVANALMPSLKQDEAELTYAIKSLALQIDYRIKGTTEVQLMKLYIKNAPHLKELTLLINQSDLDEVAKSELKSHYKFQCAIVSKAEIDQAIITADKTKAITLVMPNSDGSFTFKVFDAFNMDILGQSATIPPSEYYPELNNKIKINHLEDFTHYCD